MRWLHFDDDTGSGSEITTAIGDDRGESRAAEELGPLKEKGEGKRPFGYEDLLDDINCLDLPYALFNFRLEGGATISSMMHIREVFLVQLPRKQLFLSVIENLHLESPIIPFMSKKISLPKLFLQCIHYNK